MDFIKDLPINALDLGVIVVLLLSAVVAYARGFIQEVLSIGSWIGAIVITIYAYPLLQPYARDLIPIELAADLAAGAVTFVVALAVLSLLTRGLSKYVQESALNVVDRSLGFLFGLLRGAFLICAAFIGVELLIARADQPNWVREAKSMPLIVSGADFIRSVIPDNLSDQISPPEGLKATDVPFDSDAVVNRLLNPPPRGEAANPDGAYGNKARRELERLLDGTSGATQEPDAPNSGDGTKP